ncbi:MAG: ParB/RepB/Spo0J family partition protein, partial [Planctomycetota bacterium]
MAERKLGRGLDSLLGAEEAAGEQVVELTLEELQGGPHQPRADFDDARLAELAASIRESGLLQPVLVRPGPNGYEIVAGERRARAARLAGLSRIPALVRDYTDQEVLVLGLVENVQREDLNPMERAHGCRRLQDLLGGTQEDVARRLGLSQATVANLVRLLELPDEVKELVRKGALGMGHARAILGLGGKAARVEMAGRAVNQELSVRAVEELVRSGRQGPPRRRKRPRKTAQVAALETELRRAFGSKVAIQDRRGKGRIV